MRGALLQRQEIGLEPRETLLLLEASVCVAALLVLVPAAVRVTPVLVPALAPVPVPVPIPEETATSLVADVAEETGLGSLHGSGTSSGQSTHAIHRGRPFWLGAHEYVLRVFVAPHVASYRATQRIHSAWPFWQHKRELVLMMSVAPALVLLENYALLYSSCWACWPLDKMLARGQCATHDASLQPAPELKAAVAPE